MTHTLCYKQPRSAAALNTIAVMMSFVLGMPVRGAERSDVHFAAVVSIGGQNAGTYSEQTTHQGGQIEDTVEQDFILNRLGSKIEIRSKEVDVEDTRGRLLGAHIESSSSKTTVVTDLLVKGNILTVTTQSGGKSYSRSVLFSGELLGPAGMRSLTSQIERTHQPARYQTFSSVVLSIAEITLTPAGRETLTIDRAQVDTTKLEYRIAGIPEATTMWVDAEGYTVRDIQDSPFGPIEVQRTKHPQAITTGAQLPADSYEKSIAISNIRLPHPRRLQSVTVEISAKNPAGIHWPDFASSTQRVIAQSPRRVMLAISQVHVRAQRSPREGPLASYLAPNVLLQSDDARVREIATKASAGESDPWRIALALQRWVNENMQFDPGIAVAPASEVARDRHGTCLGYSILLASLARAENIPSRLKVGYVYDGKMWAGHAWVEVFINGQWRPLDAAEYAPGVADAARIAAITETGQSGTIEHIGELGKLYSNVDIRILSFGLRGRTVVVGPTAADHSVDGNRYDNPWLGLRVVKPAQSSFGELDSHWPDPAVLTVKDGDSEARILYTRVDAATTARGLVADILMSQKSDAAFEKVKLSGYPAIRARAKSKEVIVAMRDDVAWAIVASGPNAHELLASLIPEIVISDAL